MEEEDSPSLSLLMTTAETASVGVLINPPRGRSEG